jgi:hypothetical protein
VTLRIRPPSMWKSPQNGHVIGTLALAVMRGCRMCWVLGWVGGSWIA